MLLAMRDDEKTGRITLAQVAQQAGVSISTVSKVLNGRQDVAAPTRIKVERLLEAHAYRRTTRSAHEAPLIEIVFHELESIWAMELIRGVENVAKTHGAGAVVLTESGTRHAPGPDWMEAMLQRRPLGVVLVFSALPGEVKEQLRARSIPFVIIDPAGDPDPDVPSVGSANWNGGLAATRHLIECGHRRIGVITGPEDMLCSRARLDGYRSAMTMAGLEVDPALILFGDFHVEGGYDRATEMLSRPRPPTAIFAGERPPGPRRPGSRPGPGPARPPRPLGRRLRRRLPRPLGQPRPDHHPPAPPPDGGGGHPDADAPTRQGTGLHPPGTGHEPGGPEEHGGSRRGLNNGP